MTQAQQIIDKNKTLVEKELRRIYKNSSNFDYIIDAFSNFLETCNVNGLIEHPDFKKQMRYIVIAFANTQSKEVEKQANLMIYGKEKVSLKERISYHNSK